MFKRKYEFKPDRSRASLLSKLYVTKKQRVAILRWLLSAVFLVAVLLLQDVILSQVRVFGAALDLAAAVLLMHCIMLDPEAGAPFILAGSAFYWLSGSAPGVYVIALMTVIGVMGGIIRQGYLYDRFGSVMLCTLCAIGIYELVIFGFNCFLGYTTVDRLLTHMTGAGITFCVMPLFYPVIKAIGKIGGTTWNE